ncbi:TPA: thrombospondin type 3 repeat-containing protein, partial [Streptococcus suis]
DTDGDGQPDVTDKDDDNDSIPDDVEKQNGTDPKTPNTDTTVTPATVVEGQPVPDTTVVTPESPNTVITPSAPVNGISVDENGKLTGTPDITDWKDDEETRTVNIPVTVTTDGVEKVVQVPVTIQRDTDGDGQPDVTDTDDDNDGIPDTEETANGTDPKTPNTDTTVTPATVVEGQPVPDTTVVTPESPNTVITPSEPVNGISVDENGKLTGTPDITDWKDDEETREITIPVTVTTDGVEKVIEVPVTIQRDTDGDGTPDVTDKDDDGDGIPDDVEKQNGTDPKTPNTDSAVTPATVVEGQPVEGTKVVTPESPNSVITPSEPVNGVSVDSNGNLTGTPDITDWKDDEEARTVNIPVTVTTDGVEKVVNVPVTIQRDTDGDGIPDVTDTDDDGDGIPDEQDNNPKTAKDTTVTADGSTVVAGKEITPIPVTVDSDAKNPTVEVTGLPEGLSYNPATNQIEGTPSGKELPEGQDTVDVPATITVTDGSGNPVTKDITITVQRDTDGDGIPDVTDTDDDNDGIPDTEETANGTDPKTPNTDSAVTPATVVEGQPVEGTKVVTPESPNSVITPSEPVNGVSVDSNGNLTGTPDITDWKDDEETRTVNIPVTVTTDGVEKVVNVPVTIQRDTDGDGIPDATDSDDDGDGIPDEQDNNPKTAKDTTVTADGSTVVAGKEITPIPVTVDSDA